MLKIAIAAKEIAVSLDETNAASLNSHSARTFFIFGRVCFCLYAGSRFICSIVVSTPNRIDKIQKKKQIF